jgi:hypothetical protein
MYNPLANNPSDQLVYDFFKSNNIVLALSRTDEDIQKIHGLISGIASNVALFEPVVAHIFALGITFRRTSFLDMAEEFGCWDNSLINNNPIWTEYIFTKISNLSELPNNAVLDALVKASFYYDQDMIADLIYLGLFDSDTFEESNKKITRMSASMQAYMHLCSQHDIDPALAIEKICDAVMYTNVTMNNKYIENFVPELCKILGRVTPPYSFVKKCLERSSIGVEVLPFSRQSFVNEISSKKSCGLNYELALLLINHMDDFPNDVFSFVKGLPIKTMTSPASIELLKSIFSGSWLGLNSSSQDDFCYWAESLIKQDYFSSSRLISSGIRECSGSVSSLLAAHILENNGHDIYIEESREANVSQAILKNIELIENKSIDCFVNSLAQNKTARSLVQTYDRIHENKEEGYDKNSLSTIDKIRFMCCNLLAENDYLCGKNIQISDKTPFHFEMKASPRDGNKLHSHACYYKLFLRQMSPESILDAVNEKGMRTALLFGLLKDKEIPMSYSSKLKPTDRRKLLDHDFSI